ncbi:isochorismatase family protein [Miltoncostaea marina]|uniref:isochorismatase family protein n=1 Tax=Miltoncostaea marina TaxID=2843215 RepID=UPI001C3D54E7|nr:isochorismatase family protein [Miltoncostaea marina]
MADDDPIRFDERTALVVVDVQNDFADPSGSLYVTGGEEVVPRVNDLVAAARAAGAPVVYTQDWHPPSTPHFRDEGGAWPVHCVRDTWGAELHPGLTVDGPVVRKGTGREDGYSGFHARDEVTGEERSTGLRAILEERAVERVVVVGLARDVCVTATAIDARGLGYAATVVLDATRPVEVTPGDDARTRAEMAAAGVDLR